VTANRSWHELYAAAMLELDLATLQGRIEIAQAAIQRAMKGLGSARECATEELREMSAALGNLQALQRVTLGGSKGTGPEPASDLGVSYATHVPQGINPGLAQTAAGGNGSASSRESHERSKQAGIPERQSCEP
jgi:hypothetical protein